MSERLCINCKHYQGPDGVEGFGRSPAQCLALAGKHNPILGGDIESVEVSVMRMVMCGWSDPRLFEPLDANSRKR